MLLLMRCALCLVLLGGAVKALDMEFGEILLAGSGSSQATTTRKHLDTLNFSCAGGRATVELSGQNFVTISLDGDVSVLIVSSTGELDHLRPIEQMWGDHQRFVCEDDTIFIASSRILTLVSLEHLSELLASRGSRGVARHYQNLYKALVASNGSQTGICFMAALISRSDEVYDEELRVMRVDATLPKWHAAKPVSDKGSLASMIRGLWSNTMSSFQTLPKQQPAPQAERPAENRTAEDNLSDDDDDGDDDDAADSYKTITEQLGLDATDDSAELSSEMFSIIPRDYSDGPDRNWWTPCATRLKIASTLSRFFTGLFFIVIALTLFL